MAADQERHQIGVTVNRRIAEKQTPRRQ